tara:strand:- start:50 stop:652 length:603 start_codon:yes stop_codon:yes gene_type:complete
MNYFTPFTVPIFYEDCSFIEKDNLIESLTQKIKNNNDNLKQVLDIQDFLFAKNFISFIETKFKEVFYNHLNHTTNTTPFLVSSWYNYYEKGGEIPTHSHKNSFYSGIYYPYGNNKSPIFFENPLEQSLIIYPEVKDHNNFNYITFKVSCPQETILFFPSYLRHYTMAGSGIKHSISFNFFIEGSLNAKTKSNFKIKVSRY